MSIYGYDGPTGMLEIRNPWGSMKGQTWDTTFEVGLSTLLADGDSITVDNVGDSVSKLVQAMAGFSSRDAAATASTPVHADAVATPSPVLASPLH